MTALGTYLRLTPPNRALIREATRAAVVEASDRLGYRPNQAARSLRRKHTSVLSLLVQDLANPCFVDIAVAARTAAEARGYEVYLGGLHEYRAGRPSLACDLIEPLRVAAVDRWVLATCNQRELMPEAFHREDDGAKSCVHGAEET